MPAGLYDPDIGPWLIILYLILVFLGILILGILRIGG